MQTGPRMLCEIQAPFCSSLFRHSVTQTWPCHFQSGTWVYVHTSVWTHPKENKLGTETMHFSQNSNKLPLYLLLYSSISNKTRDLVTTHEFLSAGHYRLAASASYCLPCIPEQFRRHGLALGICPSSRYSESQHSSPAQTAAKYSVALSVRASRNNTRAWGKGKHRQAIYSTA